MIAATKNKKPTATPAERELELMRKRFEIVVDCLTPHQVEHYLMRVMSGALDQPKAKGVAS